MSECTHRWFITNFRAGYLVLEGCTHCGGRSSFFSREPAPPIDEYQEGKHFWSYMCSYQAVKFDLECSACGRVVGLDDMNALMLSTCNDPRCAVAELRRSRGSSRVYVALCADNTHTTGRCVSAGGIGALNEYFNQDLEPSDSRVVVVPCERCSSIDTCRGIVLADTGLTELY